MGRDLCGRSPKWYKNDPSGAVPANDTGLRKGEDRFDPCLLYTSLLEQELGWEVVLAYNTEKLGKDGTFGRTSYREILLTRYFRQALQTLNPWITPIQLDEAQKKMESHLSTASLMQINEEKYTLIRDGIPVTVKRPGGKTEEKNAMVIDFHNPENNHFLAVQELKIHGELYRRRTDVVGFVNGIPLLFIELKKTTVDVQNAYTCLLYTSRCV